MAKNKEEKTNVMRTLDQKKIPYTAHSYDPDGPIDGVSVAQTLGQPPEQVFKTLVTKAASGAYYVFDIPVAENLDLKKAAKAVGEKSVAMLPQKELLPLTGYVHGVPRDSTAIRHHLRQRGQDRPSGGVRSQRPHRPSAGENG